MFYWCQRHCKRASMGSVEMCFFLSMSAVRGTSTSLSGGNALGLSLGLSIPFYCLTKKNQHINRITLHQTSIQLLCCLHQHQHIIFSLLKSNILGRAAPAPSTPAANMSKRSHPRAPHPPDDIVTTRKPRVRLHAAFS